MITVRNLSYTYRGAERPALTAISFAVQPGEIFGFLGPSGAGKSTTQKILMGLLRDFAGQVEVLGRDVRAWGRDLYRQVGVSFELPNHYLKLTARENLAFFAGLYDGADPMTALAWVGLADDADKPVGQYSKGMKNRLNLARALLHRPGLLFLDEPTAGLDPVNQGLVKDLIRAQRDAGTTIFLTTHNMSVADALCDRVAFLIDGEIKLIDAPTALKRRFSERRVEVEIGQNGASQVLAFPLDGLGQNAEFLRLIREEPLQAIRTHEQSLEDIFIGVTGRQLA